MINNFFISKKKKFGDLPTYIAKLINFFYYQLYFLFYLVLVI